MFISCFRTLSDSKKSGQSLIEVLVSVTIGVIIFGVVATLIVSALRAGSQAEQIQVGTGLARGLMDNVRIFSEQGWGSITALATSSANHYYLTTSTSPFSVIFGDESVSVSSTVYTRYFYLDDVGRDGAGKILQSGGGYDPSTKKITIVYQWPGSAVNTISTYLTRSGNNIYFQTDWSGGPGQSGPASTTNNSFATSLNIDYSTTTGSFYIQF